MQQCHEAKVSKCGKDLVAAATNHFPAAPSLEKFLVQGVAEYCSCIQKCEILGT